MNDLLPPLDFFDDGLRPYLPYLGAIAVDSARIEWGLSGLYSLLSNVPQQEALSLAVDRLVRKIRQATRLAEGTPRGLHAQEVDQWSRRTGQLLNRRGHLMHSSWLVESEHTPNEELPPELAVPESPATDSLLGERRVFTQRMRGQDQPVEWTVDGLATFAHEMHDHMQMYPAMWFAAGFVAGIWDRAQ